MYNEAISVNNKDILVDIEVSPNSKRFEVTGFNSWRNRFEVRIKQVPQKGKANKEIIKEFSKLFNCDVSIAKGDKSSQKTVVFHNTSKETVFNKFQELIK